MDQSKIAIIGYGNQGRAQALNLRDSGKQVIVGARPGKGSKKAVEDGFDVYDIEKASAMADIIILLLPDEVAAEIYNKSIAKYIKGKTLCFSHGFNIVYGYIKPKDCDVILVAPFAVASEVRSAYVDGRWVFSYLSVYMDTSGKAKETAIEIARSLKFKTIEGKFEHETYGDLFGEQNVLCGGVIDLVKMAYEVFTEAGYPKEVAYFGIYHELKFLVDLMHREGIYKTNEMISNTAEWGEYVNGPLIIEESVRMRMRESLKKIVDGRFAKDWMAEANSGMKNLKSKREALKKHGLEITGNDIRSKMH